MWRYLAGAAAALMLVAAGMFVFRGTARTPFTVPLAPPANASVAQDTPLPDPPEADARTREQKRFDRIDKDKNGTITRDEFFALRRHLFAKMDADHDGKLSFDEWAYRGIDKFNLADKDKSGTLDRAEFATTALKRKANAKCACGKVVAPAPAPASKDDSDDE